MGRFILLGDSQQKLIRILIDKLFHAWEEKDLECYLSCWTNDAVRVIGSTNTVVENITEIEECFRKSISRYSAINVQSSVIEDIEIRKSTPNEAVAEVHYRFQLIRESDYLPVHEEATEFFVLRKTVAAGWQIRSNLDHSRDVSR